MLPILPMSVPIDARPSFVKSCAEKMGETHTSYQSVMPVTAMAYFFQAGVLFFHGECKRDCFKQSLFREEKNAYSHFYHIHHSKHQMFHLMYYIILYPKRNQVCHSNKEIRQPKHQIRRLISKDNATKPPRTPSISKRICQPKHQVHHLLLIKCLLQL